MIKLNNNILIDPLQVCMAKKETHTTGDGPYGYTHAHYLFIMKLKDGEEIIVFYNGGDTEELQGAAEKLRDAEFDLLLEASQ